MNAITSLAVVCALIVVVHSGRTPTPADEAAYKKQTDAMAAFCAAPVTDSEETWFKCTSAHLALFEVCANCSICSMVVIILCRLSHR